MINAQRLNEEMDNGALQLTNENHVGMDEKATSETAPSNRLCTRHIVVHRVECSNSERYHNGHKAIADYLDTPRLVKGSTRATHLRGKRSLSNVDNYLEEHEDISFAVFKTYSCNEYHAEIKDRFERLPMPPMEESIAAQAAPYFFRLKDDAKPAIPQSEFISVSNNLKKALDALSLKEPDDLSNWNVVKNPAFPYLQLYHCKHLLTGVSASELDIPNQLHLETLYRYLDEHLAAEYEEAELLFRKGIASRMHWAKLFRPNEVVVTMENEQPRAYLSTVCPSPDSNTLVLQCWSWEFDGRFWRNQTDLRIQWPSYADTVSITQLGAYPLRFDQTGLEERLKRRGTEFWSCRKRKLISYDVPLHGMELQIVGLLSCMSWDILTKTGQSAVHDRHGDLQVDA
jgi:hypothetical protein